jgi:hypothetical protein
VCYVAQALAAIDTDIGQKGYFWMETNCIMAEKETIPQLGPVIVKLMQGVVYRDQHEAIWRDLMSLQVQVIDYLRVIGLSLEMDESEGFAYLRQQESDKSEGNAIPKLVQRRPLSYPVSLLCVLLREKLIEADAGGSEIRVVLTKDQIIEMMRVFLPDQANEARLIDKIGTHINKVVELGFLRKHQKETNVYEVRRIIKALVDADWLSDVDEKLRLYREYIINN